MNKDDLWSRNPNVVFRVVAGERLLVPVRGEAARSRRLYTLNPLGAAVWEILDEARSFGSLCEALMIRYPGVSVGRVEEDTSRFLLELESFGLLRRGRETGAHGV